MNLHALVAPVIAAINPWVLCTINASTGYNVNAAGQQVPQYAIFAQVPCQIQPLTGDDLRQIDGLNQQGTYRSIHVTGIWNGVSRPLLKGGDTVIAPDQNTWLVKQVLEQWPDWTRLAVVLQLKGT